MTITLVEALRRILTSTSIGEGPEATCVPGRLPEEFASFKPNPQRVNDIYVFLLADAGPVRNWGILLDPRMPVRIERKLRNWRIVDATTESELLRVHPWDERRNVAYLQAQPPADLTGLSELADELERVANKSERIRQFVIAENLWGMVAVVRKHTNGNHVGALREAERLRVLIAQLATPPAPPTPS